MKKRYRSAGIWWWVASPTVGNHAEGEDVRSVLRAVAANNQVLRMTCCSNRNILHTRWELERVDWAAVQAFVVTRPRRSARSIVVILSSSTVPTLIQASGVRSRIWGVL